MMGSSSQTLKSKDEGFIIYLQLLPDFIIASPKS